MARNKDRIISWHGVDADKTTSLFEYGFLIRWDQMNRQHQIIYKIDRDKWGVNTVSEGELDNLTLESWFDINSFCSCIGCEIAEWLERSFVNKLCDLLSCVGYQNIIGFSSRSITTKEVCKMVRIKFQKEYMYI